MKYFVESLRLAILLAGVGFAVSAYSTGPVSLLSMAFFVLQFGATSLLAAALNRYPLVWGASTCMFPMIGPMLLLLMRRLPHDETERVTAWLSRGHEIGKYCVRCGHSVPISSGPGQRCPNCGIVWSHEASGREDRITTMSDPSSPQPTFAAGVPWGFAILALYGLMAYLMACFAQQGPRATGASVIVPVSVVVVVTVIAWLLAILRT